MPTIYVTKRGEGIPLKALPLMLAAKVQQAAEKKALELYPATLPTYDVELMGGGVQTFAHDEKSIEGNEAATQAWNAYQAALKQRDEYRGQKMMRFYVLEGTDVQLPTDDAWAARQAFYGIELPEDPMERLYEYITTQLLSHPDEVFDLMGKIMEESNVPHEDLNAARATFRRVMGNQEEANPAGSTVGIDSGAGATSALVDLAPLPTNGHDGAVEPTPVTMGYAIG